jgi:hypothetical protein
MEAETHRNIADQWLDRALPQYGQAEPRVGLEGRLLANLRAEQTPVAKRRPWWAAPVAAAAFVIIGVGIFLATGYRGNRKEIAGVPRTVATQHQRSVLSDRKPAVLADLKVQKRPVPQRQTALAAEPGEPKQQQFPAPRPLSEQEKMLTRYVQESPKEAKQAALALTALLRQDMLEFEKQNETRALPRESSQ